MDCVAFVYNVLPILAILASVGFPRFALLLFSFWRAVYPSSRIARTAYNCACICAVCSLKRLNAGGNGECCVLINVAHGL